MATEYESIPAPGFWKGNDTTNPEILYSTVGFTQKGVTLAAGQGVLAAGTVLAQNSTTKRYVAYASGGANGTGTARGILRTGVDTGTDADGPEKLGNIVIAGILKNNAIVGADAGARTTLGAVVDTVRGTFKF